MISWYVSIVNAKEIPCDLKSNVSQTSSSSADSRPVSEAEEIFVLKRIVGMDSSLRLSAIREAYFGRLLRNHPQIARFVESFQDRVHDDQPSNDDEFWLVFRHEGISLQDVLYQALPDGRRRISSEWETLQQNPLKLERVIHHIIKQVVQALNYCHSKFQITHRDVKPSNILIQRSASNASLHEWVIRLADFGSAVDKYSSTHFYE